MMPPAPKIFFASWLLLAGLYSLVLVLWNVRHGVIHLKDQDLSLKDEPKSFYLLLGIVILSAFFLIFAAVFSFLEVILKANIFTLLGEPAPFLQWILMASCTITGLHTIWATVRLSVAALERLFTKVISKLRRPKG